MEQVYSGFAIIMMAVLVFDRADSWLVKIVLGFGAGTQSEESEEDLYLRSRAGNWRN